MGTVHTFYSYKGGVGRSLALADVAVILARRGRRVLCIDWDLEAPGLHTYFAGFGAGPGPGVLELVEAFRSGPGPDSVDPMASIQPLQVEGCNGRLHFLSAGRPDASYGARLHAIPWADIYQQRGFGYALEQWRTRWAEAFDLVLIDSRTGISDIGGICTIHLPDVLVVLLTPNEQSLDGTLHVARSAQEKQAALPIDRAPLRVVPVPTRIDSTEYKLREQWMNRIVETFSPFVAAWSDDPGRAPDAVRHLAVPYVPFWSYGEGLPVLSDKPGDHLSVGFAHTNLARLLESGVQDLSTLPPAEPSTVDDLRERTVVVVNLQRDSMLANAVIQAISARGRSVVGRHEEVWELWDDSPNPPALVEFLDGWLEGRKTPLELVLITDRGRGYPVWPLLDATCTWAAQFPEEVRLHRVHVTSGDAESEGMDYGRGRATSPPLVSAPPVGRIALSRFAERVADAVLASDQGIDLDGDAPRVATTS